MKGQSKETEWENEFKNFLAKADIPKEYTSISGISQKRLYGPADAAGFKYYEDLGFPGFFPFTRGAFPAGYLARRWNIRQVVGLGTAEETNERIKYLISQGQTAIAVVGATKSALGSYPFDTDDERTVGFVGKSGVTLDTLEDWRVLFDGIDLRKISVHLISFSPLALAMYIALCEERGIPLREIRGGQSLQVRTSPLGLDPMEFCLKNIPNFNCVYIDMRNVREAGCTAPQEIAFGITQMLDLLQLLSVRGLTVDQVALRTSWFVNATLELFEEIAKFRAMRRLWAKFMRDCGAMAPSSMRLRMHCQTYAPSLTYQQPLNNIARSTISALAAVMGGVQSLHVNSFDEALATPSEMSASLSVRTQQIIYYETGIPEVIDPLGGSYYIEWLTSKLEEEAVRIINIIQSQGGYFKALHWVQSQIRLEAYESILELESKKRVLVGVNEFVEKDDQQLKLVTSAGFLQEYNPDWREKQIRKLNDIRKKRDGAKCQAAKGKLYDALRKRENMMPALIQAVKSQLTAGEVASIYEEETGEKWDFYEAPEIIQHT